MDQDNATLETEERSSLGRRSVLKGVAWSVPVVAVVGATPAMAVSNAKLLVTKISAVRTTASPRKVVTFTISVSNSNSISIDITDISFTTNEGWGTYTNKITPIVDANDVQTFSFSATDSDASVATTKLIFTLVDSRGADYNVTVTIKAGSVETTSTTMTFS